MENKSLKIDVTIDGERYSQAQLSRYEYGRVLHVLHELKHLGIDIKDGNKSLSHIDINWTEPEKAKQLLIDTRLNLGVEKTLALFKDILKDSEERWKVYNKDFKYDEVQLGVIETNVTGLTIQDMQTKNSFETEDLRPGLSMMPEHYFIIGKLSEHKQIGMETFGCFGEPSYVSGNMLNQIPEGLPIERLKDFPICLAGSMVWQETGFPINVGAVHQYKPLENGFILNSTFFCPKDAPKAIAEGHKIHFAIEISNDFKNTFARIHQ